MLLPGRLVCFVCPFTRKRSRATSCSTWENGRMPVLQLERLPLCRLYLCCSHKQLASLLVVVRLSRLLTSVPAIDAAGLRSEEVATTDDGDSCCVSPSSYTLFLLSF
ncbi:hypothetical protein LX32DRAFT_285535 [Colletotrichum zoysiae]|uniref:Uncharacterized protein n=1 Tax=Colletotrichum zoysiae TaxID=1216348 RepID=A0AAD9M7B1_9PEZI|nr:hypothetical protein LX32DRAFT_285535 [Colletotrichum zoysiae]